MKFPIKEPLPDYTREVFGSRIMATDADSPLAPDLCRFLLVTSGMTNPSGSLRIMATEQTLPLA